MAAVEGPQPSRSLNRRLDPNPEMEAFWKAVAQKWREQDEQPTLPQPEPTGNIMTPRPPVPFFGRGTRAASTEAPNQ